MGLIGNEGPDPSALATMRERGGTWAAYQNHDLGSRDTGHLKFIQFGPENTFKEPPKPRLPDTATEINWRYYFVGIVNLKAGKIEEATP